MRMFISLGSNVEPSVHLRQALGELRRRFTVAAVSPVYRTVPVGDTDQPDFWNMAVEVASEEPPQKVQAALRYIEALLGRRRDPGRPSGPRIVDLDLVLVDGLSGRFGGLDLPSPLLAKEAFVAVPLADLAPEVLHPTLSTPIGELACSLAAAAPDPPRRLDATVEG
jgi:2-amino-4-hydroxy-6-hydroxymethyldihydropteridine diphosphokinase